MIRTLADWQDIIASWHCEAFPWANLSHVLRKLDEERAETLAAWHRRNDVEVADELADCLICVLAAMAREGIDADAALASKFDRVKAKYAEPQPDPEPELPW